jgi:hypothetical protein
LLWVLHNARSGCCFPSYERIADKAGCARSTVAEAIKALEFANVLNWQNRITRVRERCRDLWGREGLALAGHQDQQLLPGHDPKAAAQARFSSKSDQRMGTPDQEVKPTLQTPTIDLTSTLERALARFGAAVAAKEGLEQGAAG